jgi:hypothetical protein
MPVPREIVWAAIEFARVVREHSDATDEQIEQMFDVFDPGLKRAILMTVLNPMGIVRSAADNGYRNKIQAIKEVRALTGWGLKEAKDFVDLAEVGNGVKLPGTFGCEIVEKLSRALEGTGYKVY